METFIEPFKVYGLAGLLAGGNLLALIIVTTRTIPALMKDFRVDLRAAREEYLKSLRIERKINLRAMNRIELKHVANTAKVAEELEKFGAILLEAIETMHKAKP